MARASDTYIPIVYAQYGKLVRARPPERLGCARRIRCGEARIRMARSDGDGVRGAAAGGREARGYAAFAIVLILLLIAASLRFA